MILEFNEIEKIFSKVFCLSVLEGIYMNNSLAFPNNVILNNGTEMPLIGLGTFPLNGQELMKAVRVAAKCGYRSFDTSVSYKNEESLGSALKESTLSRDSYFLTTKIGNKEQRTARIREAFEASLEKLKTQYVDLYLMHWPNPETYLNTWKEMEKIYKEGLARSIGVCNCHEHHLEEILRITEIIPAVNQVEIHPLLTQVPLRTFCSKNKIQMVAYSPLARMHEKLISSPSLIKLSEKYKKTIPQLILRWNYDNRVVSIPASKTENRIKENINIFDFQLETEDIKLINALNCDFRVRHNPDTCDYTKL